MPDFISDHLLNRAPVPAVHHGEDRTAQVCVTLGRGTAALLIDFLQFRMAVHTQADFNFRFGIGFTRGYVYPPAEQECLRTG